MNSGTLQSHRKTPRRDQIAADLRSEGTIQNHDRATAKTVLLSPVADFPRSAVQRDTLVSPSACNRMMLWIDGVGAWQICVGDQFVLGAPSIDDPVADIALLANISRRHATIRQQADAWQLEAHQETRVAGAAVDSTTTLSSGDEIRLGGSVRLGFRVPSVLSTSAVIDFESEHRPSHSVDGVILLTDHCLLGPRRDHHICCGFWSDTVVLFHRDGQLRCRSKSEIAVNDRPVSDSAGLQHGDTVTGEDFRFRVEQLQ